MANELYYKNGDASGGNQPVAESTVTNDQLTGLFKAYVNSNEELETALADSNISTIFLMSQFICNVSTTLAGDKDIFGSEITIEGFALTGGSGEIKFHDNVYVNDGDTVLISSTDASQVFLPRVNSGDATTTIVGTGSVNVYYEKLYRGSNGSLAIVTSGNVFQSFWQNSAYDEMIARVSTTSEFAFAMNDRSIHTIIIDAQDGLSFNGGTYNFEVHPNKDIIGGKILISGNTIWEATGGTELRFFNNIFIAPNAELLLNRNKVGAKNFFAKITGKTWTNTGFPNDTTNGTFRIENSAVIYEEISDSIDLVVDSGSLIKENWSPYKTSYETHVINAQDFIYAMKSRYYTRIVVDRPIVLNGLTEDITLECVKNIVGEKLVFDASTIDFTNQYVKFYCDVVVDGNSNTSGNVFFRNILTQNSAIFNIGDDGVYEKTEGNGSIQNASGNPATISFWDNTGGSAAGGLSNGFNVRFDDDITPPPATGRMKFDNTDYSLVTEVYINKINQDDGDMTNLFPAFVKSGSNLYIQDKEDANNYVYFNVIADAVDSGTYFTVSVSYQNSLGVLPTAANSSTSVIIQSNTDSGVETVNAGANVEVNNADPQNPIVSAFPTTTAGLLSRTYFTGDTETLGAGTFYKSNRDGKGTVATATQVVSVDDNQKAFFAQDLISDPYPIDTTIYAGAYSGILNGFVSANGGEQRFTVEIYKTDIDGNPIASGITGAPVGDLGVTVVAIAQSGLIDLQSNNESQFAITAQLESDLSLLTTNRIRYHVSAEKVGTTGGSIDISTSYGNTHVAHLDVPIQSLTSTTINDDPTEFAGLATQYDINRDLKSGISANAIEIINLDGAAVKYADNPSKTLPAGIRAFYDATTSTLEISIDGTNIP
jgi:hypothetical protein